MEIHLCKWTRHDVGVVQVRAGDLFLQHGSHLELLLVRLLMRRSRAVRNVSAVLRRQEPFHAGIGSQTDQRDLLGESIAAQG